MFVRDADMTCLRQGDILSSTPFPLLRSEDIAFLGRIDRQQPQLPTPALSALTRTIRNDPNWLTVQLPVRLSFCAVISQCCDLEPRHGKILLPSFAVARLIPIPQSIIANAQRLASLGARTTPNWG